MHVFCILSIKVNIIAEVLYYLHRKDKKVLIQKLFFFLILL